MKIDPKEQIIDNLAFYGEDAETRLRIIRVLYQLPEDVISFVLDRCSFLSVGRTTSGMVLPGKIGVHAQEKRSRNCWLILLDEREIDDESVIAHEIAHAWLGHDRISAYDTEIWEIDAANLTKSWGFEGRGSDVDACNV
jgi:hypothetical protein